MTNSWNTQSGTLEHLYPKRRPGRMISPRLLTAFALFNLTATAQQYMISTVASSMAPQNPVAANSIAIANPGGVATDAGGNVYFTALNCVFKVDSAGTLTRVAGTGGAGYSGDGGPAIRATMRPAAIAVDTIGNLFIADAADRIRRVSPNGIITTVAGIGRGGYSSEGGPATSAATTVFPVAVDTMGNLFFGDGDRIRKISPSGIVNTVAGNGTFGYSGDGGPATSAAINGLYGIAVDGSGNLYIADGVNLRVRKVSPEGIITTVAGNGTSGYSGDNGQAVNAQLSGASAVAVDSAGNLFIADGKWVRKVSPAGIITTVAGNGSTGGSGDGGLAVNAAVSPIAIALDDAGSLFISDAAFRIRRVTPDGMIATVAGNGSRCLSGEGSGALGAGSYGPVGSVAIDSAGNVFIPDTYNGRVSRLSPDGVITTVAGGGTRTDDGVPAISAALGYVTGVAVDASENLFIVDTGRIRKVSPDGIITTAAGDGLCCSSGDGGPATAARLTEPYGIALDAAGDLFISDYGNSRIRKVSPDGKISTVAGNGTSGHSGDGGPATSAQLSYPMGVAVDTEGNLFIAESKWVRKVSPDGIITTVAGGSCCVYTAAGPATGVELFVSGVAVDGAGNLFIADSGFNRTFKVSPDGIATAIAGKGAQAYSGDGGPAVNAELYSPNGVATDTRGNVYVTDTGNTAIRLLKPTNQTVIVSAVVDAASESAAPITPGKIVVIYGVGLGPATLAQNQPVNGAFGTQAGGTSVYFNGVPAPILYSSSTQVAAITPYEVSGSSTAQVTVSYQGATSLAFQVPVAASAPSFFSLNGTGAGQIAGVNADGSINDASHPAKIGGYVSFYATGEGQMSPPGADGSLAVGPSYPIPLLPVSVTVGGVPAHVSYAGGAPTEVAGVMQIVIQIPSGVEAGGYVPVDLTVGTTSTVDGAAWIAVAAN